MDSDVFPRIYRTVSLISVALGSGSLQYNEIYDNKTIAVTPNPNPPPPPQLAVLRTVIL